MRPQPQLVPHRPLSQRDGHPGQRPDLPAVDPGAGEHAAGVPAGRLFRGPDRQDVSLQRADVGGHQRPRRSRLVGARDQSRRLRPARGGAADFFTRAGAVWRHAELVCLAQGRPLAHRRDHGRRRGLGARTLRARPLATVFPRRRVLSAAHAVCGPQGSLLRALPRGRDAAGHRRGRGSRGYAEGGARQPQGRAGCDDRCPTPAGPAGLSGKHQFSGCASRPRARRAR